MILPSTAEENGGLCWPCKRGDQKAIAASKEFYRKQKEYDPFQAHWHDLCTRCYEAGFDQLSEDEKIYWSASVFDGEIINGGFHQFFFNSSGELYTSVRHALITLHASKALELLDQATELLFDGAIPEVDRTKRWEQMREMPAHKPYPDWYVAFEKLDYVYDEECLEWSIAIADFAEAKGLIEPYKRTPET